MKVVQINAVSGIGSTGVIAKSISLMLNKRGVENYIFYADGKDSYKNSVKISSKADMKAHSLLSRITGKQAYFSALKTKELLHRLDGIKPDVVHLHNLHNNYINLNMLLDYLSTNGIKTVLTLHDCWFFTGKCTHYSNIGCGRWQTGCGSCPLLKADNPSWIFDRTSKIWLDKKRRFEKIDKLEVVGVSEWIANEARKSFLNCGNVSFIHNGIDTEMFNTSGGDMRSELGIKNKFVIMGIANKWQSAVNDGLLDYISENLDKDYVLLLVGGDIKKGNVISIPYQSSPKELARVYRTADVFVNVTHEDSLPTVNLEAMSCGTPVITYDVCGSTETVAEKTGIVVCEGSKEELLGAILQIKAKGKSFYSDSCRKHILNNYEMGTQFEKYFDVY